MYNLLIECNIAFEEMVSNLEKVFRTTLEVNQTDLGKRCQFYCFDMEFYLYSEHGLEDDMGIEFSKYNYVLNLYKLIRGGESKAYLKMYDSIALYYAEKISQTLKVNTLLVDDLQRKVSEFKV